MVKRKHGDTGVPNGNNSLKNVFNLLKPNSNHETSEQNDYPVDAFEFTTIDISESLGSELQDLIKRMREALKTALCDHSSAVEAGETYKELSSLRSQLFQIGQKLTDSTQIARQCELLGASVDSSLKRIDSFKESKPVKLLAAIAMLEVYRDEIPSFDPSEAYRTINEQAQELVAELADKYSFDDDIQQKLEALQNAVGTTYDPDNLKMLLAVFSFHHELFVPAQLDYVAADVRIQITDFLADYEDLSYVNRVIYDATKDDPVTKTLGVIGGPSEGYIMSPLQVGDRIVAGNDLNLENKNNFVPPVR